MHRGGERRRQFLKLGLSCLFLECSPAFAGCDRVPLGGSGIGGGVFSGCLVSQEALRQKAAKLLKLLNGDWRRSVIQHHCVPGFCSCESPQQTRDLILACLIECNAVLSGGIKTPSQNRWGTVSEVAALVSCFTMCHNVLPDSYSSAFKLYEDCNVPGGDDDDYRVVLHRTVPLVLQQSATPLPPRDGGTIPIGGGGGKLGRASNFFEMQCPTEPVLQGPLAPSTRGNIGSLWRLRCRSDSLPMF